jgi:hypothetical protein
VRSIKEFYRRFRDGLFQQLEAPRRNYEKIIINNMDHLYPTSARGDVVLVEGNSHISRMIKLFTQSSWSHCALYVGDALLTSAGVDRKAVLKQIGDDDGRHLIVEAINGTGVIAAPLRKYQDVNIRICRPYGILPPDLDAVISETIGNIGKRYDHRNIVDLALLFLPPLVNPLKKRTIQACLGNCSEFQVICSGMIARAFQHVGYPIIPALSPISSNRPGERYNPYGASLIMRHYSQIVPKHFDISPNFQIVKFNIIEGGVFDYKALWARTLAGSPPTGGCAADGCRENRSVA